MLALVSRTASSRTACRCRTCFRRSTTLVSKRQLNRGDLFTTFYSTLIGTAVYADARIKEDRRKEWDRVIAQARASLQEQVDSQQEPETASSPDESRPSSEPILETAALVDATVNEDGMQASEQNVVDAGGALQVEDELNKRAETVLCSPASQLVDEMSERDELEAWNAMALWDEIPSTTRTQSPIPDYSVEEEKEWEKEWEEECAQTSIEDSVASYTPLFDGFKHRESTRSENKVKLEEAVEKLVYKLLPDGASLQESTSNPAIASQIREVYNRLEEKCSSTRLPSFHSLDRSELNKTIELLLSSIATDQSNVDLVVAKVCYNLMVSPCPPNIDTYNIMIRGFNKFKLHNLSQFVIDIQLHNSMFVPRSETIQLMLNHYTEQRDFVGFRSVVDRMRAAYGRDMNIRRRSVDDLRHGWIREWISSTRVGKIHHCRLTNTLREKVSRDSAIFTCLINGFNEFDRRRTAVVYLRAAFREGVPISSTTFLNLIEACVANREHQIGVRILSVLVKENLDQLVFDAPVCTAIRHLFALCGLPFSEILDFGTDRRESQTGMLRTSYQFIRDLQHRVILETVEHHLRRLERYTYKLRTLLGCRHATPSKNPPPDLKQRQALKLLYTLEEERAEERELRKLQEEFTRDSASRGHPSWVTFQRSKLKGRWREQYEELMAREEEEDIPCFIKLEVLSYLRAKLDLDVQLLAYLERRSRRKHVTSYVSCVYWPTIDWKPIYKPVSVFKTSISPDPSPPLLPPVMYVSMAPIRTSKEEDLTEREQLFSLEPENE